MLSKIFWEVQEIFKTEFDEVEIEEDLNLMKVSSDEIHFIDLTLHQTPHRMTDEHFLLIEKLP